MLLAVKRRWQALSDSGHNESGGCVPSAVTLFGGAVYGGRNGAPCAISCPFVGWNHFFKRGVTVSSGYRSKRARAVCAAFARGYRVSEDGALISPSGFELSDSYKNQKGYRMFNMRLPGEAGNTSVPVHQLAAFQKYGDKAIEEGVEVRHLDDNKENNSPKNLLIGTRSQNMMDRSEEVRRRCARKAARARRRLTNKQAQQLIEDRAAGSTYLGLVEKYGIAKSTISYIVNGHMYPELDRSCLDIPK
jgi:hypothetical protein